jgi:hypothetical protein
MPAHTPRGGWVVLLTSALVLATSLSVSQADVVLDGRRGGAGALAGPTSPSMPSMGARPAPISSTASVNSI